MFRLRDKQGRFISQKELDAVKQKQEELNEKINGLVIANDNDWFVENLRTVIISMANFLGVSPEEFEKRVKVVKPTPVDPQLVIDGKPVITWI